jgi:hypothetical protein
MFEPILPNPTIPSRIRAPLNLSKLIFEKTVILKIVILSEAKDPCNFLGRGQISPKIRQRDA